MIVALLPLLVLSIAVFLTDLRKALAISLAITLVLFIMSGNSVTDVVSVSLSSAKKTSDIFLIILGALVMLNSMREKGLLDRMDRSLLSLKLSKGERFLFLSLMLTSFFEGVAGFGTPGAVVVPLLVSLGYSPLLSISTVLLVDAVAVIFGAAGTPVSAGLSAVNAGSVVVPFLSAVFNAISGMVFMAFILNWYGERHGRIDMRFAFISYAVFALSFILFSALSYHVATIASSIILGIVVILWKRKKGMSFSALTPWLPYIAASALLVAPKVLGILPTIPVLSIPLFSPFPVFMAVSAAVSGKGIWKPIANAARKSVVAFEVLFMSILVSGLMSYGDHPMIAGIGYAAKILGRMYVFASPFIGIVGAFISGSNTVSNIMFSPLQQAAAASVGISKDLVLALQNSGGGIGNAVCLFNIIAASSVVGWRKHEAVVRRNAIPVAIAGVAMGIIGFALSFIM